MLVQIYNQVENLKLLRGYPSPGTLHTSPDGTKPQYYLPGTEGFGYIIISSQFQSYNPVGSLPLCSQHNHGSLAVS